MGISRDLLGTHSRCQRQNRGMRVRSCRRRMARANGACEWRANGARVRLLAALVLVRPALDVDGLSAQHSEGDWRRVELVCLLFQNMLRVY